MGFNSDVEDFLWAGAKISIRLLNKLGRLPAPFTRFSCWVLYVIVQYKYLYMGFGHPLSEWFRTCTIRLVTLASKAYKTGGMV